MHFNWLLITYYMAAVVGLGFAIWMWIRDRRGKSTRRAISVKRPGKPTTRSSGENQSSDDSGLEPVIVKMLDDVSGLYKEEVLGGKALSGYLAKHHNLGIRWNFAEGRMPFLHRDIEGNLEAVPWQYDPKNLPYEVGNAIFVGDVEPAMPIKIPQSLFKQYGWVLPLAFGVLFLALLFAFGDKG